VGVPVTLVFPGTNSGHKKRPVTHNTHDLFVYGEPGLVFLHNRWLCNARYPASIATARVPVSV